MYAEGRGVERDSTEAVKWYRRAAGHGDLATQLLLGDLYREGRGVQEDQEEAARWYRRAAEQGLSVAQVQLSALYWIGKGVPRDYAAAHMWMDIAAVHASAGGHSRFAAVRDLMAAFLTAEQLADAQRLAKDWQPKPEKP